MRRILWPIFVLALLAPALAPQNKLQYRQPVFSVDQIDSLEKCFRSDPTVMKRITASTALIYVYRKTDARKAVYFGKEALIFARRTGLANGESEILSELGKAYDNLGEPDNAIKCYNDALAITESTKDKNLQGRLYNFIGQTYFQNANYREALRYYLRSHEVFQSLNDKERLSIAQNDIGIVNNYVGNYETSLTYYFEALKIKEKIAPDISIATTLANVGDTYSALKNYKQAEEYYRQAMSKAPDYQGRMLIMNKMARVIAELGRLAEAKNYLKYALDNLIAYGNEQFVALNLMNLGRIYLKTGEIDSSFAAFSRAYKIYDKKDRLNGKIEAGNQLAFVYINMSKPAQALKILIPSLKAADSLKLMDKSREACEYLSLAYEKLKMFEPALKFKKQAEEIKDSIYRSQRIEITAATQIQYETERKNKEIEFLTKENGYATSLRNLWITITIFTIGLAVLIYARYYQKKKNLIQLQLKNSEIRAKNTLLQRTTEELQELIATKDKFFSIISHDLKNPFNTILLISSVLADECKNYSEEQIQNFGRDLYKTAANAYKLLENLLEWSQIQRGKVKFNPLQLRINELTQNVLESLEQTAKSKNIELKINCARNYTIIADRNMIELILRNLIINGIKFSYPDNSVEIDITRENGFVLITVTDFGVGISKENVKRLFRIEGGISSRGTAQEAGTGLGLILCKEMAEMHGGTLSVKSVEGEGSAFTLSLPATMQTDADQIDSTDPLFYPSPAAKNIGSEE